MSSQIESDHKSVKRDNFRKQVCACCLSNNPIGYHIRQGSTISPWIAFLISKDNGYFRKMKLFWSIHFYTGIILATYVVTMVFGDFGFYILHICALMQILSVSIITFTKTQRARYFIHFDAFVSNSPMIFHIILQCCCRVTGKEILPPKRDYHYKKQIYWQQSNIGRSRAVVYW